MGDNIYLKKKKEAELRGALTEQITISLTPEELQILQRKADDFKEDIEQTAREYLIQGSAFDTSVFDGKKSKNGGKKEESKGVNNG